LDLAEAFGADQDWSLIGGLMVQLHGLQHDNDPRPTIDIDILGNSRRRPAMTERLAQILIDRGGEVAMPPRSNKKLGYRFEVDGEVVEILGPDGLTSNPGTIDGPHHLSGAGRDPGIEPHRDRSRSAGQGAAATAAAAKPAGRDPDQGAGRGEGETREVRLRPARPAPTSELRRRPSREKVENLD
jgi:hypothetical protein